MKQFTTKQIFLGFINLLLFGLPSMVVAVIKADPQYIEANRIYKIKKLKYQKMQQQFCRNYPNSVMAIVNRQEKLNAQK